MGNKLPKEFIGRKATSVSKNENPHYTFFINWRYCLNHASYKVCKAANSWCHYSFSNKKEL